MELMQTENRILRIVGSTGRCRHYVVRLLVGPIRYGGAAPVGRPARHRRRNKIAARSEYFPTLSRFAFAIQMNPRVRCGLKKQTGGRRGYGGGSQMNAKLALIGIAAISLASCAVAPPPPPVMMEFIRPDRADLWSGGAYRRGRKLPLGQRASHARMPARHASGVRGRALLAELRRATSPRRRDRHSANPPVRERAAPTQIGRVKRVTRAMTS